MIKTWLEAFRLRTLPLSFSCIIMGNALALYSGQFQWKVFWLAILTTLSLQILSNLSNDLGDSLKGTDNETRVGPQRTVQSGKITFRQMKMAIVIFAALSLTSGILLLMAAFTEWSAGFLAMFILGLLAIAAALYYTLGKKPYGYRALGDLVVFIFFGFVGVTGSYYLQTKSIDALVIAPSTAIGLLSVAVLNMNNMRDRLSDEQSGKITIPVLIGEKRASVYQLLLIVAAITGLLVTFIPIFNQWWQFSFCVFLLPLLMNLKKVFSHKHPSELDGELKRIALSTFAIALSLSIILYCSV